MIEKLTKVQVMPPEIDPTKNVMDLVEASSKRLDDLREAEARRINDIMTLRDRLRASYLDRITTEMALRTTHANELAAKEKERLDAIRVIDGNNLTAAVERAETTAQTLAKAVEQSAERTRASFTALDGRLSERIHQVEVFQNEAVGRRGLSTPLLLVMGGAIGALAGFLLNLIYNATVHYKVVG